MPAGAGRERHVVGPGRGRRDVERLAARATAACLAADRPSLSSLLLALDCLNDAREVQPAVRARLTDTLEQGLEDTDIERRHLLSRRDFGKIESVPHAQLARLDPQIGVVVDGKVAHRMGSGRNNRR